MNRNHGAWLLLDYFMCHLMFSCFRHNPFRFITRKFEIQFVLRARNCIEFLSVFCYDSVMFTQSSIILFNGKTRRNHQ